jgi:phage terminase large subunit-like protein
VPKPPPTTSGKLSDVARHVVLPSGLTSTGWPAVRDKSRELGIRFDPWQDGAGRIILAKRADGSYATSVGGVVMSIPRQVGKTFLLGAVVFALCLLFPGLTVIWTAHRLRTAAETFSFMQGMTRRKKIAPHVEKVVLGSGDEEIQFRNGSRILFGARERGFGRGFSMVDVLVFDEAQILTENAIDDMVPATNQAPNPLLLFTGTPPKPTDPGEVFAEKRAKALGGSSDGMAYIEFSADEDAQADDPKQWEKANPSYPHRTSAQAIMRMRENLTDDSFMREALGVWDTSKTKMVIDSISWGLAADAASMAIDRLALAVDVAPDRSVASVSFAGQRADGLWHVELDEHRAGTGWLPAWVAARCERNRIRAVVIDGKSPAASMIEDLRAAGVKVTTTSAGDMAAACGQLFDGVMEGRVRHTDQPQVNVALSVARKRPLGDAWAWNRKSAESDITPLVACTLALWGAQTSSVKRPTRKRTEGRRAVVL